MGRAFIDSVSGRAYHSYNRRFCETQNPGDILSESFDLSIDPEIELPRSSKSVAEIYLRLNQVVFAGEVLAT